MQLLHRARNRSLAASMLTLLATGLPASPGGARAAPAEPAASTASPRRNVALRADDDHRHGNEDHAARHGEDDFEIDEDRQHDDGHAPRDQLHRRLERWHAERRETEHRLRLLERAMHELQDEDGEEAQRRREEIEDEIEEAANRMERLEEAIEDAEWDLEGMDDRRDPERRDRFREPWQELRARRDALRREGRHEEAERLQAEMDQLARRRSGPFRWHERGHEPERLHHFRMAVENLRAAGLHELADRVANSMADRLGRRDDDRRPPLESVPRDDDPFSERRPDGVWQEDLPRHDLERAVRELNRQMAQMRLQMRHLQANLERMQMNLERVTDELHRRGERPRGRR